MYSLAGLAKINKVKIDAIRSAVKELEENGYIVRKRINKRGKFSRSEYIIYEEPSLAFKAELEEEETIEESQTNEKETPSEPSEEATLETAMSETATLENPMQLNTNKQNTNKQITNIKNTNLSNQSREQEKDDVIEDRGSLDNYIEIVKNNISYDTLIYRKELQRDEIDEIVCIMAEVLASSRDSFRINGEEVSSSQVKARFMELNFSHIDYVIHCLKENTSQIKNIKSYIQTVLYNAPTTISNYYINRVNVDMRGRALVTT